MFLAFVNIDSSSSLEDRVNLLYEKSKNNPNKSLIDEYQTHQISAKLFVNSGYGFSGNEHFEFTNNKLAECITTEGR